MRLHRLLTLAVATSVAALVGPAGTASASAPGALGYDVSYPQCNAVLPSAAAFVILGVNGGKVFSPNPCLAEQTAWASEWDPAPSYYANTANPGPLQSTHWPSGQRYPEVCEAEYPADDSAACAYDYGWNAAADSYSDAYAAAQQAFGSGAAEPRGEWWLDVETGNSWEAVSDATNPDAATNDVAALRGAVDYLTTEVHVARVGFYSTAEQWAAITAGADGTEGTDAGTGGASFPDNPVWLAGAADEASAAAACTSSFSGGPVALVQYPQDALDADYRCPAG